MLRKIPTLLCIIVFIVSMTSLSFAQTLPSADEIDAQVNKFLSQGKATGAALIVGLNGVTVYQYNYGYQYVKGKIPVTDDTYFRLASITKMVSGIGLMQLAEQGLVSLDADISEYFGYAIANAYYPDVPLTLRQLMSHTSALNSSGGYCNNASTIYSMLSTDANRKSNFNNIISGSKYEYSNFGAGIVGAIMESVTGESVNQYMTENVFEPLGIHAAYSAAMLNDPDYVASMYFKDGRLYRAASYSLRQEYEDSANPELHYRTTVGNCWMRARDLAKLLFVLCGDGSYQGTEILRQNTVESMRMNPSDFNASVTCDSEYGLFVNRIDSLLDGKMVYGHQGMVNDVVCNAYFEPESGFVFVLLTNGCNPARQNGISKLARQLFGYTYDLFVYDAADASET